MKIRITPPPASPALPNRLDLAPSVTFGRLEFVCTKSALGLPAIYLARPQFNGMSPSEAQSLVRNALQSYSAARIQAELENHCLRKLQMPPDWKLTRLKIGFPKDYPETSVEFLRNINGDLGLKHRFSVSRITSFGYERHSGMQLSDLSNSIECTSDHQSTLAQAHSFIWRFLALTQWDRIIEFGQAVQGNRWIDRLNIMWSANGLTGFQQDENRIPGRDCTRITKTMCKGFGLEFSPSLHRALATEFCFKSVTMAPKEMAILLKKVAAMLAKVT